MMDEMIMKIVKSFKEAAAAAALNGETHREAEVTKPGGNYFNKK